MFWPRSVLELRVGLGALDSRSIPVVSGKRFMGRADRMGLSPASAIFPLSADPAGSARACGFPPSFARVVIVHALRHS